MQRYKLIIEYAGTHYFGWNKMPDKRLGNSKISKPLPTIQGTLEDALTRLQLTQTPLVYGASRTDRGVHALGQVAHVDLPLIMSKTSGEYTEVLHADSLIQGLNTALYGKGIKVVHCETVSQDFHARFSATERTYLYRVITECGLPHEAKRFQNAPKALAISKLGPVHDEFSWKIHNKFDTEKLSQLSRFLERNEDWSAFHSAGSYPIPSKRKLSLDWKIDTCENPFIKSNYPNAKVFDFIFRSSHFVYHQVTNMMGLIANVASGAIPVETGITLTSLGKRSGLPPPAPPQGLTLLKIKYDKIKQL